MKTISSALIDQTATDTYLNSAGLDAVRKMGRDQDPQAIRQMAKQFESLFVQQMFKSMRAAGEAFSEDNFLNSSESQFYQQMLDQQLSLELTKGRGLGLADVLYQQMMQSYGDQLPKREVNEPKNAVPEGDISAAGTSGELSGPGDNPLFDSPRSFIDTIKPYANWAAGVLGVKPEALMAQAALETGWGKHVLRADDGGSSLNLFNIKTGGGWSGESVSARTLEYNEGMATDEPASFRRYASLFESFSDYVELLRKPRYREALAAGTDAPAFLQKLQEAGYATDPQYAEKIQSILERTDFGEAAAQVSAASLSGSNG